MSMFHITGELTCS